tara:strand:+ start:4930 stop:5637 length:708 start_codon:yes stop_codon:yes gene_type:complete
VTRFVTKITKDTRRYIEQDIAIAILSAGAGSRIKSYEPRSLLRIGDKSLIEHQISVIRECFEEPDIMSVVGYDCERVIKKINNSTRIVENQLHDQSNTSESIRLAFHNTAKKNFLFFHGDLYFNKETLQNLDYKKSFIIIDTSGQMADKEVGVTVSENKASILSYGLPVKWAQIVYVTGREYRILKNIFQKYTLPDKKLLSFEIVNRMIAMGAQFNCYEPEKMSIVEIDRIKDLR